MIIIIDERERERCNGRPCTLTRIIVISRVLSLYRFVLFFLLLSRYFLYRAYRVLCTRLLRFHFIMLPPLSRTRGVSLIDLIFAWTRKYIIPRSTASLSRGESTLSTADLVSAIGTRFDRRKCAQITTLAAAAACTCNTHPCLAPSTELASTVCSTCSASSSSSASPPSSFFFYLRTVKRDGSRNYRAWLNKL